MTSSSPTGYRFRLGSVLLLVVAGIYFGRLCQLQLFQHQYYLTEAKNNYFKSPNNSLNRGSIFFSTKGGELISAATLKPSYTLVINPSRLKDPEVIFQQLKTILPDLDEEIFFQSANKHDDPYEEIANRLELAIAEQIKKLNLNGVYLEKRNYRFYPARNSAAHAIGLMGYDEQDKYVGRYGLEKYYEEILARPEDKVYKNFFLEIFSGIKHRYTYKQSRQGDIVSTIEPAVQNILEQQLSVVKEEYLAESAHGIILDPQTGEIYAMASLPNYDPGAKQKDIEVLKNPLVQSVFEMGSIIKPLTMAAAIDSGAVTPETTYYDAGQITLNEKTIKNYDGRGRGTVNMQAVLNQSLNTGVVFAVQQMGLKKFGDYLHNFGFKEKSGLDLPGEIICLTSNLNSGREIEFATASFGQGIALTPIATTRALAVLANGGKLIQPHLIKKIRYANQEEVSPAITPARQVIKPETSQTITNMLVKVVDEALLGGQAKLDRFTIAAKTGTAQTSRQGQGGYSEDRYLHSFFGYFPAYQARFLVFLFVVNPQNSRYASGTMTKPFSEITKFLLNYYQVPPDR